MFSALKFQTAVFIEINQPSEQITNKPAFAYFSIWARRFRRALTQTAKKHNGERCSGAVPLFVHFSHTRKPSLPRQQVGAQMAKSHMGLIHF